MAAPSEADNILMLMRMFDDNEEAIKCSIKQGLFIAASICKLKRKRFEDYVESTVHEYCEVEFHQHFRMHRADFEVSSLYNF